MNSHNLINIVLALSKKLENILMDIQKIRFML
jgi:hypothetical protein